jgi:DNA transformation protein
VTSGSILSRRWKPQQGDSNGTSHTSEPKEDHRKSERYRHEPEEDLEQPAGDFEQSEEDHFESAQDSQEVIANRLSHSCSVAVSSSFQVLVLDQLSRAITRIRARPMFGGVGIYSGDLFFALIADDTVYFKADESTRPEFEARGMGPFRPFGEEGGTMQYYQLPEDLLEDPDALRPWAEKAVAIARRSKAKRPSRRRGA